MQPDYLTTLMRKIANLLNLLTTDQLALIRATDWARTAAGRINHKFNLLIPLLLLRGYCCHHLSLSHQIQLALVQPNLFLILISLCWRAICVLDHLVVFQALHEIQKQPNVCSFFQVLAICCNFRIDLPPNRQASARISTDCDALLVLTLAGPPYGVQAHLQAAFQGMGILVGVQQIVNPTTLLGELGCFFNTQELTNGRQLLLFDDTH